jgi:hypothetical protein
MGHEVVLFAGRAEVLNDQRLWAIRRFCLEAADSLVAEDPDDLGLMQARAYFAGWEWIGVGVIAGISFDKFIQGSGQRKAGLTRVLERAATRVRKFGSLIPFAYLEAHVNEPGAGYLGPQSARAFVRAIARLRGLLSESPLSSRPA